MDVRPKTANNRTLKSLPCAFTQNPNFFWSNINLLWTFPDIIKGELSLSERSKMDISTSYICFPLKARIDLLFKLIIFIWHHKFSTETIIKENTKDSIWGRSILGCRGTLYCPSAMCCKEQMILHKIVFMN